MSVQRGSEADCVEQKLSLLRVHVLKESEKQSLSANNNGRVRGSSGLNDRFEDFYEVKYLLGSGAFSQVYSCAKKSNRPGATEFAVKCVDARNSFSRTAALKEIEITMKFHRNILSLVDYYFDTNKFQMYLVFPRMYCSLVDYAIDERGCLDETDCKTVIEQLLSALKFLHGRGIAHRDLKLDNVLCSPPPDCLSPVKLSDFGLSAGCLHMAINKSAPVSPTASADSNGGPFQGDVAAPGVHATSPKLLTPVGSCEFMAPEVARSWIDAEATPYDKRCDIWSLGVMMYILLCGYPPFWGCCDQPDCQGSMDMNSCADCQYDLFRRIEAGEFSFPPEDWAHISDDAKSVIKLMLTKDPFERPNVVAVTHHDWFLDFDDEDDELNSAGVGRTGLSFVVSAAFDGDSDLTPGSVIPASEHLANVAASSQSSSASHGLDVKDLKAYARNLNMLQRQVSYSRSQESSQKSNGPGPSAAGGSGGGGGNDSEPDDQELQHQMKENLNLSVLTSDWSTAVSSPAFSPVGPKRSVDLGQQGLFGSFLTASSSAITSHSQDGGHDISAGTAEGAGSSASSNNGGSGSGVRFLIGEDFMDIE